MVWKIIILYCCQLFFTIPFNKLDFHISKQFKLQSDASSVTSRRAVINKPVRQSNIPIKNSLAPKTKESKFFSTQRFEEQSFLPIDKYLKVRVWP